MNGEIERRRDKSLDSFGTLEAGRWQVAISAFQLSTFQLLPPGVGQIAGVVLIFFEHLENFCESVEDWGGSSDDRAVEGENARDTTLFTSNSDLFRLFKHIGAPVKP